MKILLILSVLLAVATPKVYQKCELARVLRGNGLDGFHRYSLANWVCLVQYESNYNTNAIGRNRKHGVIVSSDYGIFQINSYWWCNDGQTLNTRNRCHKNCNDFLNSDITDDIECAKRVVRDPQGMYAWYGWQNNCANRDLSHFLDECHL
ncbi:lysozyme C-1-like [Scyliorhinus canicula]|uniref:lysozyme C-1-like n=1 Tax=Scyliorhinus canicula TaxID=7830 RepID=UPI0018F7CEF4|nr:lysozyme C-1-like [Scyliorhinus canicula]XP_038657283.1 lysozyme C-1-like [Scyliorhinus canicula]